MDNNALKEAAQKELLRRAAQKELERRRASAPPVSNAAEKGERELSWADYLKDIGLSAVQGISTGAQELAGALGTAQETAGDVAAWGAEKIGLSPESQETARQIGKRLQTFPIITPMPTGEQIKSTVREKFGPEYEPKTKTGEAVEKIGEFAPSAFAGPGSVLRRGAMAVIPGLAVEGAGELTGDNPLAEAGAGIASSLLAAGRGGDAIESIANYATGRKGEGIREAIKSAPSAKEIVDETDDLYDSLRSAGVSYDNNAYEQFIRDLQREMKYRGYRPRKNSPSPITSDLEELADAANKHLDFAELESLRRTIGTTLPAGASNADRAAAAFVREKFDDFLESAPLITSGNIPADQVNFITKKARELASRNIKNRTVEEAIEQARDARSGFENGLRIEFRKIKRNPKKFRFFSQAEKEAITNIVRPGTTQNLLAQFGRLGIGLDKLTARASALPTFIAGGGYGIGQFLPAAAVVGAATGAKYLSRLLAEKSAKDLSALMRTGKTEQIRAAAADEIARRQSRIRAGLSGTAAVLQSTPEEIDIPGGDLPVRENAGGRVARKSGGRIKMNSISAEIKRVRALLSEKTASMLSVPDDAIATALHIAKKT
jgi:hypothetical protein